VGQHPAGLQYEPADDGEHGRPAGVGAVGDQYVPLAQSADIAQVADDPGLPGDLAAAGRQADEHSAGFGVLVRCGRIDPLLTGLEVLRRHRLLVIEPIKLKHPSADLGRWAGQ